MNDWKETNMGKDRESAGRWLVDKQIERCQVFSHHGSDDASSYELSNATASKKSTFKFNLLSISLIIIELLVNLLVKNPLEITKMVNKMNNVQIYLDKLSVCNKGMDGRVG